jgi:hypothetical protein
MLSVEMLLLISLGALTGTGDSGQDGGAWWVNSLEGCTGRGDSSGRLNFGASKTSPKSSD